MRDGGSIGGRLLPLAGEGARSADEGPSVCDAHGICVGPLTRPSATLSRKRERAITIALGVCRCVLHPAFCNLHFCILHFAFCILHFAFCILHFAFCILHSAFCILHSAFCVLR